jgi:hypothetical protein
VVRPGHRQDVRPPPAPPHRDGRGQRPRPRCHGSCVAPLRGAGGRCASRPPFVLRGRPRPLGPGGPGVLGPVCPVGDQRHGRGGHVADSAPAGDAGPPRGRGRPRPPRTSALGAGGWKPWSRPASPRTPQVAAARCAARLSREPAVEATAAPTNPGRPAWQSSPGAPRRLRAQSAGRFRRRAVGPACGRRAGPVPQATGPATRSVSRSVPPRRALGQRRVRPRPRCRRPGLVPGSPKSTPGCSGAGAAKAWSSASGAWGRCRVTHWRRTCYWAARAGRGSPVRASGARCGRAGGGSARAACGAVGVGTTGVEGGRRDRPGTP